MKKLLILLTILSASQVKAQLNENVIMRFARFPQVLEKSLQPHPGMALPFKINLKERVGSLMQKQECYLHLLKPITVQRDEDLVEMGTISLNVAKRDFFNRRLLPAGTHLKLNSIIVDNKYGFENKITFVDSVFSEIWNFDFWETKVQNLDTLDVFLMSDGKLFLECSEPEAVIVK